MGDVSEETGLRIRRLRLQRGLTQSYLAEPEYTSAYVSSVESGRRKPSHEALRHFAQRLGVSEHLLASGQEMDPSVELELAFVQALATNAGMASVAESARQLSDQRRLAWALLAINPVKHLAEAEQLLEGEPPQDRVPLVLARIETAEPRYAVHVLEEALDDLHGRGYPHPNARYVLNAHLAEGYLAIGDEARAGAAAEQALALAGPLDRYTVANEYLITARTLIEARRPDDAMVALAQARCILGTARIDAARSACYRARALMRRDRGDLEGAVSDLRLAAQLATDDARVADVKVELAEAHRRQGKPEQATQLVTDVLAGADERAPQRMARAWREWALLALEQDEPDAAEQRLHEAIRRYRVAGPRHEFARVLRTLGDLLCEQDRVAEAAELLHTGLVDLERITR